jgi:hypothetical protein
MKRIYLMALLLCFIAGVGIYASSFRHSWYTVSKQELGALSQRLADKPRDERWREWYDQTARLETPRKTLHDLGIGVSAFAVVLAVLHFTFGFPLKRSRTPKKKWMFILVYLLALAAQVPASVYYLGHRQSRFEYPPWGDSIIIGLFQTVFGCAVFAVIGSLLFLAILWKATLPADLFVWSRSRPVASTIITVIFGALAALCLSLIPDPVRDGSVGGVIMTTVMLYLFMSARAGMVEYQLMKTGNSEQPDGEPTQESAQSAAP